VLGLVKAEFATTGELDGGEQFPAGAVDRTGLLDGLFALARRLRGGRTSRPRP